MSLSFLFCKPWHPATTWNQKKIWEAEQKDAKRKKDEETANKELVRESDRIKYEHMAGGKAEPDSSSNSLNFMYAPPPGFQQPQEEELKDEDEAVKKFKALAKMKSDPNFSANAQASELEKLVGRRINPGVSLAEQQERFPFLKNAPVEHEYAAGVKVNFKPFNNVVRHVKCMRCGEWGHRSGDRECRLINENPNDTERRLREDPMSYMSKGGGGATTGMEGHFSAAAAAENGEGGEDPDTAFLKTLSSKEKRRLLRRLQEMEAVEGEEGNGHKSSKTSSRKRKKDNRDGKGKKGAKSESSSSKAGKEAKSGRNEKKREKAAISSTEESSLLLNDGGRGEREHSGGKRRKKALELAKASTSSSETSSDATPASSAGVSRKHRRRDDDDDDGVNGRSCRDAREQKEVRRRGERDTGADRREKGDGRKRSRCSSDERAEENGRHDERRQQRQEHRNDNDAAGATSRSRCRGDAKTERRVEHARDRTRDWGRVDGRSGSKNTDDGAGDSGRRGGRERRKDSSKRSRDRERKR